MVVGGIADMLMKLGEGTEAILALPGAENCFEPTAQYGIDGVTEKVTLNELVFHTLFVLTLFVFSSSYTCLDARKRKKSRL